MGEKIVKFPSTPVAKAVEEKIGKPLQQVNEVIGSEVKAACADPAQGNDTLLENSHIYIEEEGRGKDTDQVTTRPRMILRRSRNSTLPLPRLACCMHAAN